MEKLNTNIFTQGMKILLSAHLVYLISRNNLGFQMLMKIGNICSPLRKEFILLWMVYVESSTKYVLCSQTSSLNVTMCNRNYHFFMLSSNIFFPGCKFSSIGPIYYEYGSMVLTFDNSKASVQAYELLRNSYYEEKKLLGKHSIYIRTVSS